MATRPASVTNARDDVRAEPLPDVLPSPSQVVGAVPPPNTPSDARRSATNGGGIRLLLEAEPAHLNPLLETDASASQISVGTIYESLISCAGPSFGYLPALADSWQVSLDGLHIVLHLRSGVRWHDGHTLNVLDVQASLEPLLVANSVSPPFLRSTVDEIASLEMLPERSVRLNLKRPSDYALRALCDVPILPDHLLRGPNADPGLLAKQPIGTGPFRFQGWDRGKRIRLTRFGEYWGQTARLDEVTFEFDADGARALSRTRRGEVDVLLRVLPMYYPTEVDSVTLHGSLSLVRTVPERWAYVAVNHRHGPLGDAAFRRSLSGLWDRDRFARDLHRGLAHPLRSAPYAPMDGLAQDGRAQAVKGLEDNGYRDSNADGVRDVNGVPIHLSLLFAAGSRSATTESRAFVLESRKAGLLVDAVPMDSAALMARVKKGDYDLALMLWEGRADEDPSHLFGSTGAFNHFGYRSPEVDGLLDGLRAASGPVARAPIVATLTATLARDQPVLFLYRFDRLMLVANRVHGLAALGDHLDLQRTWTDP